MPFAYLEAHFRRFLGELALSPSDHADAQGKARRVAKSLYSQYYPGRDFDPSCYILIGSYGKGTAILPRSDVDMIFLMPWEEANRTNSLLGNKQSQMLQKAKRVLEEQTFTTTDIKADGPVVICDFLTYKVEVVPSWPMGDGRYFNGHTKDGGRWALAHPAAELDHLDRADAASGGMARDLIRMLKAWKRNCNVPIRSNHLEIAAVIFIEQWEYRGKGLNYYDWMVRDFFQFLLRFVNGRAKPAGVEDWKDLGDLWQTRTQSAFDRASRASTLEHQDQASAAVEEWQKIFGYQFRHTQAETINYLAGLL